MPPTTTPFKLPRLNNGPSPKLARQILNKLKIGTSPPGAAQYLWVDRGGWASRMDRQLSSVSEDELTDMRMVAGLYGSGKSHALASMATIAFDRNWAVARLNFSETNGFNPVDVFQKVTTRLTVPERFHASDAEAAKALLNDIEDGLTWVFNHHADAMLKRHAGEALPAQGADAELRDKSHRSSLPLVADRALTGYFRARWDGNVSTCQAIEAWWQKGEPVKRPVSLEKPTDGHLLLGALVKILRSLGYAGLLITVDELEAALKLPARKRSATWENLRAQIDMTEAPGMLVMLAIASPSLNQKNGPEENDALRSRLLQAKRAMLDPGKPFDPSATILALDKLEFSETELLDVAHQIKDLFEIGHGKEATHLDDETIERLVHEVIELSGQRTAARCRALVQALVEGLSQREDDAEASLDGLRATIQTAVRQEL
jgi:hypothetical protein